MMHLTNIFFFIFKTPSSWFGPFSPLGPSTSEIWSIWKAKFSYLYLRPVVLSRVQFQCSTWALWLLTPAKQEKIIGESFWGAGRPRRDSHCSGGKENTSPTCLRGMFTAPGIDPSEASSWGWRCNCREEHISKNLSHVHNKNILRVQGSAELFIGGGGWENGGRGRRRKKPHEWKPGRAGRRE